MKTIFAILIIAIAVLASGCTSTAPQAAPAATAAMTTATPDLVGIWTGVTNGHINALGYVDQGTPVYNITSQKGQAFVGYKEYPQVLQNGTKQSEEFSGVINARGEIFIGEKEAGVIIGDLTGPDTMELSYIEDGDEAKALIIILNRQKS
ncbi:MAG: hypothetical protein WC379_04190 [Methanoregula sp.]|jgi:ABC-type Fe3+-hydroxamate transport system substrate-binding protein